MIPIKIQSRMITSIFFDQRDGGVRLCLANGEERRFTGVSLDALADLVNAPSPGTHYVEHFRHRQRRAA